MPSDAEIQAFVSALTAGSRNFMEGFRAIHEANMLREKQKILAETMRQQAKQEQLERLMKTVTDAAKGEIPPEVLSIVGDSFAPESGYIEQLVNFMKEMRDQGVRAQSETVKSMVMSMQPGPNSFIPDEAAKQQLLQRIDEIANSGGPAAKESLNIILNWVNRAATPSKFQNIVTTGTPEAFESIYGRELAKRMAGLQVKYDENFVKEVEKNASAASTLLDQYRYFNPEEKVFSGKIAEHADEIYGLINTFRTFFPNNTLLSEDFLNAAQNTYQLNQFTRALGLSKISNYGLSPVSNVDLDYVSSLYTMMPDMSNRRVAAVIFSVANARRAITANEIVGNAQNALRRGDSEGYKYFMEQAVNTFKKNPFSPEFLAEEEISFIEKATGKSLSEIFKNVYGRTPGQQPGQPTRPESGAVPKSAVGGEEEVYLYHIPPAYMNVFGGGVANEKKLIDALNNKSISEKQAFAITAYDRISRNPPGKLEEYINVINSVANEASVNPNALEADLIRSLEPYEADGKNYTFNQLSNIYSSTMYSEGAVRERIKIAKILAKSIQEKLGVSPELAPKIVVRLVRGVNEQDLKAK